MIKVPKTKVLLVLALVIIISTGFYWYQIRPTQIKHDCSWVEEHKTEVPEIIALTEAELKEKGMIKDCSQLTWLKDIETVGNSLPPRTGSRDLCELQNKETIEKYEKYKPYEPASNYYRKATEEEYKFCLHDKGL